MVCHFVTILNMGLSTSDKSKMVFEQFFFVLTKKNEIKWENVISKENEKRFFYEDFHFCLLSCIYANDNIFFYREGRIDVKM